MNINSFDYWNERFASGRWVALGGPTQTTNFADAQVSILKIPRQFSGSILDFGCGTGDAIPVYRKRWPNAELVAVDFSEAAISAARVSYGGLAQFCVATDENCPEASVIIASNVMEHLRDDIQAIRNLLDKCADLYVVVPFEEQFLIEEHVRRYDRNSFSEFNAVAINVFACRGWSQYGMRALWWEIYAKNLLRPLFGRRRIRRRLQAMYRLKGSR